MGTQQGVPTGAQLVRVGGGLAGDPVDGGQLFPEDLSIQGVEVMATQGLEGQPDDDEYDGDRSHEQQAQAQGERTRFHDASGTSNR
ncbi:hypothetical protein Q3H58_004638 [Pseudomonas psychrotolerans]|nr:hypothetical protein [Pseudomonas psychrotolerans]